MQGKGNLMIQIIVFILIFLISIPALSPLLQKGFFVTHDIVFLARISAAANSLSDGQFPLRWVSDFRYGEPLFNYYAPLPYYLGAFVHFLGFDFITTTKIILIFVTFLSGFFMFMLAREFWGVPGGILSAILYLYAPYRGVDLYVRGAFSEIFSFVFLPLIFWGYYLFFKTKKYTYALFGALFLALLILTHNISSFIFFPFFLIYIMYYSLSLTKKQVFMIIASLVLAFGLSSSYWIPAYFEKELVQSQKTILSLDFFVNQFVKPIDFIKPNQTLSITHYVGVLPLIILILVILTIFFRVKKKTTKVIILFILLFLFSLFMQTIYSLQIWLIFSPLQFVQFPWRFSLLSIFFLSLVCGSIFLFLERRKLWKKTTILGVLILITIYYQYPYFRPNSWDVDANDKKMILLEDAYLPKEYLPVGVKENPKIEIKTPVDADTLQALEFNDLIKKSNSYTFIIKTDKKEQVLIPIYYFPGWQAYINGEQKSINRQSKTGLVLIPLDPGEHQVKLILGNTRIRTISNFTSLISFFILVALLYYYFKRTTYRAGKS